MLVTSGVSGGLLLVFLTLIDPGDEVIIPDPYFVIYKHIINMIGGRCVFVDSYPDFRLPVDAIACGYRENQADHSQLAGKSDRRVYDESEIRALAEIAAKADVLVLSDEIYDTFCYDGPCHSIAAVYPKTLLLKGFSKTFAMTGWRMGYVTGSAEVNDIIEQMTKLQQYTFVCAPTPFQHAAAAALNCDMSDCVAAYRRKRDMLYEGLKDTYELVRPEGRSTLSQNSRMGQVGNAVRRRPSPTTCSSYPAASSATRHALPHQLCNVGLKIEQGVENAETCQRLIASDH